jgi:hypothetical protein
MVQVSRLMIGDKIVDYKNRRIVTYSGYIDGNVIVEYKSSTYHLKYYQLRPIPITDDILMGMCNLEYNSEGKFEPIDKSINFLVYTHKGESATYIKKNDHNKFIRDNWIEVDYLHELQQLCRLINKIELPIKITN